MTPSIARRIWTKLRQIGPDPILLVRYTFHHVTSRREQQRLRHDYGRRVGTVPSGAELRLRPLDVRPLADLPASLVPAAQRIRAEAEEILRHRVDLLGSGPSELGETIDWHRDFKSGYVWPDLFYQDVTVTRLDDASDAKVPWELSRGHHLLTLARAARLFDDERYAAELHAQLDSWLAANPPGRGINWTNPMEVALRAANWVWALQTLEAWRPMDTAQRRRITEALQVHARHIGANLEGSPQLRSNHYLSDILGLLLIGAVLTGDPEIERLQRKARSAFEREIESQVYADGIGFEASLSYHGLALEIFLLARVIAGWQSEDFSESYDQRLCAMLEASRSLRQPDGRMPQIGDSDSGRVLPAGFARPSTHDHLLWLGVVAAGAARPDENTPHEEVAWTLGLDAWRTASEAPLAPEAGSEQFPQGGFFVLRGRRMHVVARCGDVGQNGNGGHSHNDTLSFELWNDGPVVVDAGTYVYTSDPSARNAFRSTHAHNTVSVAGAEINPMAEDELFRLPAFARPRLEQWESSNELTRLLVSHDGFRRLDPAVVHRREFLLDPETGTLTVSDELTGTGDQKATSYLHLAAGTRARRFGAHELALTNGSSELLVRAWGIEDLDLAEGWVSERFGVRVPALVVEATVSGALPLRFGWTLTSPTAQEGERRTRDEVTSSP